MDKPKKAKSEGDREGPVILGLSGVPLALAIGGVLVCVSPVCLFFILLIFASAPGVGPFLPSLF